MAEMIRGIALDAPVREPYTLYPIDELIRMNGLDEIAGGPPIDLDDLLSKDEMKPAIYIKNGRYDPAISEAAALCGGDVEDKKAENVRIVSYSPVIGGVYVEGAESDFTLENAYISLSGNGVGLGGRTSGAAVGDHGRLTLRNCVVDTVGANRCATAAGQNSVLRVYDSTLISHGAPFGEDAPDGGYTEDGPPAPLEILGNCRTHCTVDNSFSYFYNSTVICDGWAALSTDCSMGYVYLEARDCKVVATKSGYGAYADFCCHDKFVGCDFDVASQGIIMGGQSTGVFEDCKLRCGSYLAMIHCVMGLPVEVTELTVKDTVAAVKKAAVSIRSQNAIVDLTRSQITSESGVLVETKFNDDLFATKVRGRKVYGVDVNLTEMDARGDIIHKDHERDLRIHMKSSTLRGAICGGCLEMDKASHWLATGNSQVTFVGQLDKAQIDAPAGVTIEAKCAQQGTVELPGGGLLVMTLA